MEASGYDIKFLQERVPNREVKRPFLGFYNPDHSVAYCRGETGIAIELTLHGQEPQRGPSPYQVLMNRRLEVGDTGNALPALWRPVWLAATGATDPIGLEGPDGLEFWYDVDRKGASGVRALMVPVCNIGESVSFWTDGLGCGRRPGCRLDGGELIRLSFDAPFPHWSAEILLMEADARPIAPLLDSGGFPCLAFLSSDLNADGSRLRACGSFEDTGPFEVTVCGRNLKVGIYRGPSGELVELIEILGGR